MESGHRIQYVSRIEMGKGLLFVSVLVLFAMLLFFLVVILGDFQKTSTMN